MPTGRSAASSHDDADVTPTVHPQVAAGAAVVIMVDGERAGPVRVLLTTMPDDGPGLSALPLTSGSGAWVYALADGRGRV
ncbi:hypothetical protein AWW66_13230 [Micromonospora rosaria]|uniref:Uncharacterized protein n=1 Tax=Micromonospora rosaria TaxID=47874 RepID=A0A136PT25_9ACTN|nr:hypothetical protein AWW66_13230 [Micromonospora rosaria]